MTSKSLEKQIDNYSFKIDSLIGRGAFSQVYLGEDMRTSNKVAIKVLPLQHMRESQLKMFLTREVPIMKGLQHRNIIKVYDVLLTQHHAYVITEYCNQGDLDSLFKKKGKFTENEVKSILIDILAGLKELRRQNIMHRDLKPANIFIHNGVLKLGDFGFAKVADSQPEIKNSYVGTPLYMSPQCLQNSGYSYKSDIWSVGILSFELLYGQTPWPCGNQFQLLACLNCVPLKFPKYIKISKQMKKFMKMCLKIEESKRWSWEQLFEFELFAGKIQEIESQINKENEEKNVNKETNADANMKQFEKIERMDEGVLNYEIRRILQEAQVETKVICAVQQKPTIQIDNQPFSNLVNQLEKCKVESNFTPKDKMQSKLEVDYYQTEKIDKTLPEKYLESITSSYLDEQFKKNDKRIACIQNLIKIFNFTINLLENNIFKNKKFNSLQLKINFLLEKSSVLYNNELLKLMKNKSNQNKLCEYEQYIQKINSQQLLSYEQLNQSMREEFQIKFEKLQINETTQQNIQKDELFLKFFNKYSQDFTEIEEFSNYFIDLLSQYIKKLVSDFEENCLQHQYLSKLNILKILLISALIDCHQIFLRIQSIRFDFYEFQKQINLSEIFLKQEEKFFKKINLNYFEFLKKNIKELKI